MKRGDVASVVKLVDWQSGIPGDTGTFSQTLLVQLRAIEALQPVPGPEITELLLRKYAEYDDFNRHEVVEAIAQRDDLKSRAFVAEILESADPAIIKSVIVALGDSARSLDPKVLDLLGAKLTAGNLDYFAKGQAFDAIAASHPEQAAALVPGLLEQTPREQDPFVIHLLQWCHLKKLKPPLDLLERVVEFHRNRFVTWDAIKLIRRVRTKEAKTIAKRLEESADPPEIG
jgi:hypothetical protein